MRYLKQFLILYSLLTILLSGCSAGRQAFNKAEDLEQEGKYEEAMFSYAEAFKEDKSEGKYRIRFLSAREKAAQQRFQKGEELFAVKDYAAALAEYQAAAAMDPTQSRFAARAEFAYQLKNGVQAYREGLDFEKANKLKDAERAFARAVEIDPDNLEYQAAKSRVSVIKRSKLEGYELNLKSNKPITLKFRDARIKDVFTIVSQLSGINFIFDDSVKDQPVTVFIENATFQQVMDLLATMNKLGRKVLNENTIIIYAKTPEKVKQYEDMTVRTFHLNHLDAKKAVNLIRTMLQVRKIYVNEDSNSLVVRDTSDVVDVVGKILDANDVPEPEVVLDVEVIEVTDRDAINVGLLLSNYNVQLGAFSPENRLMSTTLSLPPVTTGTTAPGTAGITELVRAFTIKGYSGYVTVPNAQYNFGKTLGNAQVLSNPKIRVKNKEKSKFTVGTRIPITTTTTNGNLGGVSVNVQYVDVGVKVNAEPTIQLNNEIVIKLNLEVSSLLSRETVGGTESATVVATIGTRNLDTVLSLKDGETSIIGGLISDNKNVNKQKIFLLGDIPLLGELFSNNNTTKDKSELIFAITPRLIRGVMVPHNSLTSFISGKEDDPTLVRLQPPVEESADTKMPNNKLLNKRAREEEQPVPAPIVPFPSPQQNKSQMFAPVLPPQQSVIEPLAQDQKSVAPAPSAIEEDSSQFPSTGKMSPDAQLQNGTDAQINSSASSAPGAPVSSPAQTPVQRGTLQFLTPSRLSPEQDFKLEVKVTDVKDLSSAPFTVTYDPAFVTFVSASEGNFLKRGGGATTFTSSNEAVSGTLTINNSRSAGTGGVSGSGTLASLVFRSKNNKGGAGFGFSNVNFATVSGASHPMLPFNTAVEIK